MNARFANSEDDGSLDLLLDTVCNAFGGIVFITLAIVLFPTRTNDTVQPVANEQDVAQLYVLERVLMQKSQLLNLLGETGESFQHPDLTDKYKKLKEMEALERNLHEALEVSQMKMDDLRDERESASRNLLQLEAMKAKLQSAFLDSESRNKEDLEVRSTRLPRLRKVNKNNFFIVLKGGRVLMPQEPGTASLQFAYNEDQFFVEFMGASVVLTPKDQAGLPAGEWLREAGGPEKIKRVLDAKGYIVNFLVYPDSIEHFAAVRNAFTASGYDYNWIPLSPNEKIPVVRVSGPMDAQ